MNLSNKIIKSHDIKLIKLQNTLQSVEKKENSISKNDSDIQSKIIEIRKETEEKIKIAEKKAYDKGFLEGIEQYKKEVSKALESIKKMIEDFKVLKEEYFKKSEKDIINLIFLIAKKVIHKEVSISRDIILALLRDTAKNIQDKEGIKIRINPKDYNYILQSAPDFVSNFCKNTVIEADEAIEQGGALIETYSGGIDARLDHQLSKIEERLSSEG